MKHTKKRVAALLLTLAMVLSLMPMAFAADFEDMPAEDDASYAAVKSAVDNGLLKGEDGKLNLEGSMTRATMAALITRVFGAKGEADMSAFSDAEGHWAVESGELPAAVAMGIMNGSNGKMLPNDQVTLEQVITMLVRALGLPMGTADDLKDVAGADSVTAWAVPYVAALVKAGYDVPDLAGAAQPMTRVAFTEMIYKVSGEGNYVKEAGEITEDVDGNIIITADGVSLKGITVKGDVIIADGVDAGSIVLDGAKVEGRLVVRGGQDVSLTNGATAASTVVAKPAGELTVKADDASDAGAITVTGTDSKAAEKVTVDMAEPKVTVEAGTTLAVQNAKGGEVTLKADGAKVAVESGTVANVTVADGAKDVAVDVAADATIEKVTTNTDLTVTGEGTVTEKEGSGTVTDAAGTEVSGSDEPADVPVVTTPSTPDEVDPNAPTNPEHTHNYGDWEPFDATRHIRICEDKAATGTEGQPDYVPAIKGCDAATYGAHSWGDKVVDEEVVGQECTVCHMPKPGSKTETEPTDTADETTDELKAQCAENGHIWEDVEDEGNKTLGCEQDGVQKQKCKTCHATHVVTTAAKGHSLKVKSTTAATCKVDGEIVYECTNAGCEADIPKVTIPATGEHKWVKDAANVQNQAATCKATGVAVYKCSVCSTTQNQTLEKDPNNHVWGEAVHVDGTNNHKFTCTNDEHTTPVTKTEACALSDKKGESNGAVTATCETEGKEATKECSVCHNEVEGKVIPAKGHVWASGWTTSAEKHWHKCGNDANHKKDEATHTWDKANEDGSAKAGAVCTVCGYAYGGGATTPTHEHNWVNGTCTNDTNRPAGGCKCDNEAQHAALQAAKFPDEEACSACGLKGNKACTATEHAGHDSDATWTCPHCNKVFENGVEQTGG